MTGSGAGVRLGNRPADGRRPEKASWQVDAVDTGQARRNRRRSVGQLWRRFIAAIRDGDEHMVEQAILQLAGRRKIFAPLALIVGAFVMLFSALRLLVTNWRLMLVQALPALLIWAVTLDLKAHVLHGKEFNVVRGPIVVVLFVLAVLVTIGAFFLNAAFAFAISQPGAPDLKAGFRQARRSARAVIGWGTVIGLALGVAAILVPRWGLRWFALSLGIVLAVMMVCYVAVPARIVGVQIAKPADMTGRRDKLAATALAGLVSGIICTPPYVISRVGEGLLSGSLFAFGVALIVIGLTLEAGATGAVKAIKVSAKLLGGRSPAAPGGQADGATPAWATKTSSQPSGTPESKINDQLGTGQ
jgi:hypothetical protein